MLFGYFATRELSNSIFNHCEAYDVESAEAHPTRTRPGRETARYESVFILVYL